MFQLAMLAEKNRRWAEAKYWLEEYLRRDASSTLAKKVRQDLSYVRWVILYEKTLAGWQRREALNYRDQAKRALLKGEWVEADAFASKAIQQLYVGWDAVAIKGIALYKMEMYMGAAVCLEAALEICPPAQRAGLGPVLTLCKTKGEFAEARQDADIKATAKKYPEAAAAYIKAWEIVPTRYDVAVAALTCFVLAEDYNAAKGVLQRIAIVQPDRSKLPSGLRDQETLMAQLDKLGSLGPKMKVASNKPTKARSKGSSSGTKKSMAQDFLSRIKKK